MDTSYAARGPSGTAVYIEQVVAALRERGQVEVVEAQIPGRPAPGRKSGGPLRSAANAARDLEWLHRGLPAAARAAKADVVHHPIPAWTPRIAAPQVSTLLDLAFVHHPEATGGSGASSPRAGIARPRATPARCCRSPRPRLATLSSSSVPTASGSWSRTSARARPGVPSLRRSPGATSSTSATPRRARTSTACWRRMRNTGRRPRYPPTSCLRAPPPSCATGPGVRGAGRPAPGALLDLLRGARALVHPALHEGFGLTVLEAMAVGTPVLAVNAAAVAEVAGDAALLVEPGGIADGLARLASDDELHARLRAAGPTHAGLYSWNASARLHEQAYALAADGP